MNMTSETKVIKLINIQLFQHHATQPQNTLKNKASQAIQSPRTVPFFLLISLLDGYSFANVHVKGIVAFKHLKKL